MQFSALVSALLLLVSLTAISAFTACRQYSSTSSSSSALNLFGTGGEKKGQQQQQMPGIMDQLAMFKKAQEVATKKKKIDDDLQKMLFQGVSADGNVKVSMKYVPATNPMETSPEYEAVGFDFDDAFFDAASPDDLAASAESAIESGIEQTNLAVAEKYAALQGDIMQALGGGAPPPPPPKNE